MHKIPSALEEFAVPIDSLVPFPGNPRRGDVEAIKESLNSSVGQYKPIVIRAGTREILAGNHTTRAAKELGWTEIAAVEVDVDDEQARRIVLADNRIGDLGDMDIEALLSLLDQGDIAATGYTDQEVQRLSSQYEATGLFGDIERESVGNAADLENGEPGHIQVGPYRFTVEEEEFLPWSVEIEQEAAGTEFARPRDVIRERLGLQGAMPTTFRKERKRKPKSVSSEQLGKLNELNVPLRTLKTYPGNARRGDINAIAESLKVNAQYRPLVVSARTLRVLSGNHTFLAASAMGWDSIAAILLDVDEDQERQIVLADNKLAQRGSYDMDDLTEMLKPFAENPEGTGFSTEDIEEILGKADDDALENRRIWIQVSHRPTEVLWRVPCTVKGFTTWLEDDVRAMVGASDEAVEKEVRRRLEL